MNVMEEIFQIRSCIEILLNYPGSLNYPVAYSMMLMSPHGTKYSSRLTVSK